MSHQKKMKGLLKGLRYISQIFDEEKEQEMQIGVPTDVKHVAHIGWDGPAVDTPSWMKEFNSTTGFSAPLGLPEDHNGNSDFKWVSEDSKKGQRAKDSQAKDLPDVPKTSRRQSSTDNNSNESPRRRDPSTKSRSRRKESKDPSESGVKSSQQPQESSGVGPDIPRKGRRKKSKELGVSEGGSRRSRNRAPTSSGSDISTDPGPADTGGPVLQNPSSQLSPLPSVDEERASRLNF